MVCRFMKNGDSSFHIIHIEPANKMSDKLEDQWIDHPAGTLKR